MPRLTDEQRAARRKGLGSSDVAAIVCGQYGRSVWDVYNEKTGAVVPDNEPDDAKEMGHELEPVIAGWYERATGARTIPGGTFWHRDHAWAFATLDRRTVYIDGDGKPMPAPTTPTGVECKLVGARTFCDWSDADDGLPDYVRVQIVWQLFVTQLARIDVAAYLGGTKRRIYIVERDAKLEQLVFGVARDAWEHIEARTQPRMLDDSDACREYLQARYPKDTRPLREATPEEAVIMSARDDAAARERHGKAARIALDNQLRDVIGDAAGIYSSSYRAKWKVGKGGERRYRFSTVRAKGADDGEE